MGVSFNLIAKLTTRRVYLFQLASPHELILAHSSSPVNGLAQSDSSELESSDEDESLLESSSSELSPLLIFVFLFIAWASWLVNAAIVLFYVGAGTAVERPVTVDYDEETMLCFFAVSYIICFVLVDAFLKLSRTSGVDSNYLMRSSYSFSDNCFPSDSSGTFLSLFAYAASCSASVSGLSVCFV